MPFKNRFVILTSGFLIFAAVPPAPAAQLNQENNRQIQQDRTNDTNRKQRTNQTISKDRVRQVQTALKSRGFDPGPIDGVMGPKTMAAVRDFQSGQGLTSSGIIDEPTMNALQSKAATGSATNPQRSTNPRTSGNVPSPQSPQPNNPTPQAMAATPQSPSDIGVGPTAFDLEDVRQAQMALRNRGFDPGEMNGMISSQTQEAIRQFQMARNLPVTGKLDQQTQAALGILIKGTDQEERRTKPGP
jgi:peptidoglycan hydrolase-like protein with peptidoglycan-binding domain